MSLTEKQLEMRKTGIGASEIAALAGLSRWATPIQIFESKATDYRQEETLPMELGNLFEEPVAKLYAKRTGLHVRKSGTLRHRDLTFALATPDRLVFKEPGLQSVGDADRLLQIKTTAHRDEWGEPGTDEIPEDHLAQVIWELGVTERQRCDVAVLFTGWRKEFELYRVDYDPAFFGRLYEIAAQFMAEHVLAGKPPPPDASEQYAKFLGRRFPTDALAEIREGTPELADLAKRLESIMAQATAIETEQKQIENVVKTFIGDATGVQVDGYAKPFTWKSNAASEKTDWETAFRELGLKLGATGEQIEAVVRASTVTKPGARVLRKPWTGQKKK